MDVLGSPTHFWIGAGNPTIKARVSDYQFVRGDCVQGTSYFQVAYFQVNSNLSKGRQAE